MKIKSIFSFMLVITSVTAFAQSKVSISGFVGYTLQDNIYFSNSYDGYIEDCAQYGGILEYEFRPKISLGISYMHMDTHVPIYDAYNYQVNQNSDATAINYLMFDIIKYFQGPGALSVVSPYVGIGAGMAMLNVKNGDSYTKFAWDGKFGVKIRMSAHIALFAQAQVQSIVQGVGGSMYISTGGAGVGISSYSSVYQFSFGGGLSFNL